MSRELQLPVWAKEIADHSPKVCCLVEVDSAKAYPEWLNLLEVTEPDQYWLETAYQCIKLDVHAALAGTRVDPRTAGRPTEIRFTNAPDFALANHPTGRGPALATQGREARGYYIKVRGGMPF